MKKGMVPKNLILEDLKGSFSRTENISGDLQSQFSDVESYIAQKGGQPQRYLSSPLSAPHG